MERDNANFIICTNHLRGFFVKKENGKERLLRREDIAGLEIKDLDYKKKPFAIGYVIKGGNADKILKYSCKVIKIEDGPDMIRYIKKMYSENFKVSYSLDKIVEYIHCHVVKFINKSDGTKALQYIKCRPKFNKKIDILLDMLNNCNVREESEAVIEAIGILNVIKNLNSDIKDKDILKADAIQVYNLSNILKSVG
ncbi:hypothetical protein [Clostridium tarantellae]|uniref:Uncharacterized protein n=1 Tax=Clostridium tarantellae TaxID=39493 RepID=A0A6I1MWZ3_9CLOT|nr:hypothetical protein [Clostridium tarantellae]MPQ45301.1 hypothetical protein [Clostridium tarantellae]